MSILEDPHGRPVAIALDTVSDRSCFRHNIANCIIVQKGPEIRTGLMRDGIDVRYS